MSARRLTDFNASPRSSKLISIVYDFGSISSSVSVKFPSLIVLLAIPVSKEKVFVEERSLPVLMYRWKYKLQ